MASIQGVCLIAGLSARSPHPAQSPPGERATSASPVRSGMSDNREFIEEFLVESTENLDQLDRDLIALEERPDDPQRLASIFRTVHTIKGVAMESRSMEAPP